MKIKFQKPEIVSAMSSVDSIIPMHSSKPVYRNALIKPLNSNTIEITGVDEENGITIKVKANADSVEGKDSIAIDSKLFNQHIMNSPSEDIEIERNNEDDSDKIIVKDGESTVVFLSANPEEFIEIMDYKKGKKLSLKSETMTRLIKQTLFATAKEERSYAINGVFIKIEGSAIEMVATDGHRLAVSRGDIENNDKIEYGSVFPVKVMSEINKICNGIDSQENVLIQIEDGYVIFEAGPVCLMCNSIKGSFPSYKNVIPTSMKKNLKVNREIFSRLLKRASVMVSEETRTVTFDINKNEMVITSRSSGKGEGKYKTSVDFSDSESMRIAFTPQYLQDVLRIIDDETLEIKLNSPEKPVMIEKEKEFQYVIMPVRPQ